MQKEHFWQEFLWNGHPTFLPTNRIGELFGANENERHSCHGNGEEHTLQILRK